MSGNQTLRNNTGNSRCNRCGAAFDCGVTAGLGHCWCMDLPVLDPSVRTGSGCYCPDCLRALTTQANISVAPTASEP